MGLGDACRALFEQLRRLFEIGAANRDRGDRLLTLRRFLGDLAAYRRLARHYPSTR